MGVNFEPVIDRMLHAGRGRYKNMSAVARSLDVTPQALSNYKKHGKIKIPTDLVVKFAEMNNLSVDWLIFGKGEGPASPQENIPQIKDLNPDELVYVGKALKVLRGEESLSKSFRHAVDSFRKVQVETQARS